MYTDIFFNFSSIRTDFISNILDNLYLQDPHTIYGQKKKTGVSKCWNILNYFELDLNLKLSENPFHYKCQCTQEQLYGNVREEDDFEHNQTNLHMRNKVYNVKNYLHLLR